MSVLWASEDAPGTQPPAAPGWVLHRIQRGAGERFAWPEPLRLGRPSVPAGDRLHGPRRPCPQGAGAAGVPVQHLCEERAPVDHEA
eukprot:13057767-Alexandrium_andersonii.AAC.1